MLVVCLQFFYLNVVLEIFRILQKTCIEKRGLFYFSKYQKNHVFSKLKASFSKLYQVQFNLILPITL